MKPALTLSILLLVAACAEGGAMLNPTVARLDEDKTLAQVGDDATLSRMPVTCRASDPGCAQLHAVRAGACRRTLAHDCAVSEYRAALAAARVVPDPKADPATLRLALLEAAHARRDAARGSAADAANQSLLAEATAAQADPATRSAGYFHAANAGLFGALQSPPPGGCQALSRAGADLAQARTAGTSLDANGRALGQAIANAQSARGCAT